MSTERPILFSGPMVRAILEGRKTQTRRLLKPQPAHISGIGTVLDIDTITGKSCPYGKPGTRLWVRETHYVERAPSEGHTGFILYKASDPEAPVSKWRPSIHMPRWASRITLEVESVRVERLQDISGPDCWAEGIVHAPDEHGDLPGSVIDSFRVLWESINGPGSWDANPWVWAIAFKHIKP